MYKTAISLIFCMGL